MNMKYKHLILLIIGILIIVLVINVMLTFYYQHRTLTDSGDFDVIVIPGEGAYHDTLPANNDTLGMDVVARMDDAAALFASQPKKPIIILSGYGRWYKERPSGDQEANMMYEYMLHKIDNTTTDPAQYLIKENQSHNTIENAIFSEQKIPRDAHRILVLATSKSKRL